MKYRYVLVMMVMLSPFVAIQADDDLLSENWWQTATSELIKQKIAKGADSKAKDEYGRAALMVAAEYNKNPDIIKLLLAKGPMLKQAIKTVKPPLIISNEKNKIARQKVSPTGYSMMHNTNNM